MRGDIGCNQEFNEVVDCNEAFNRVIEDIDEKELLDFINSDGNYSAIKFSNYQNNSLKS